ncbi:hypothetical protein KJY78_03040 [Canibacter sp. lx-45]|nr:hypothetical protein [Canibacter zhuwentaonis]
MMRFRTLKDGRVVVTNASLTPLIFNSLEDWNNWKHSHSDANESQDIRQPEGIFWEISRLLVRLLGTAGLCLTLVFILSHSILPSARIWASLDHSLLISFLLLVLVAIVSTVAHELMHMIFGRSIHLSSNLITFVMRTKLNHIWSWPKLCAIDALLLGIALDFALAGVAVLFFLTTGIQFALFVWSVLVFRILWQFNIFAKRDVALTINFLLDKPEGFLHRLDWRVRSGLAIFCDTIYLACWVFPLLVDLPQGGFRWL